MPFLVIFSGPEIKSLAYKHWRIMWLTLIMNLIEYHQNWLTSTMINDNISLLLTNFSSFHCFDSFLCPFQKRKLHEWNQYYFLQTEMHSFTQTSDEKHLLFFFLIKLWNCVFFSFRDSLFAFWLLSKCWKLQLKSFCKENCQGPFIFLF